MNSHCCSDECRKDAKKRYERTSDYKINRKLSKLLAGARHRSKNSGKPFDLDRAFIEELLTLQDSRCAVTNEEFIFEFSEGTKHRANSPSLDQIEAGKGYTRDNVRLVTYQCNVALNQWGEGRLKDFARLVLGEAK